MGQLREYHWLSRDEWLDRVQEQPVESRGFNWAALVTWLVIGGIFGTLLAVGERGGWEYVRHIVR